jgi:hypothetical protein
MSAKAANKDRAFMQAQADRLAQVGFNPSSVFGPGGMGVTFGDGKSTFNLGAQQGIFDALGAASLEGLAGGQGLQGLGIDAFNMKGIGQNNRATNQAFRQLNRLNKKGFRRGAQNQLFGLGKEFLGNLDFGDLRDENLSLLREMAQPHEAKAFQGLQENQFATGRLGSSGGALMTEAFAKGLAEADLGRQQSSIGLAQAQQRQNFGLGIGALQQGQGLAGFEDQLRNSAFGRFAGGIGVNQQQSQGLFNMGSSLFGQGLQGLGGQNAIMQQLLGMGTFGANLGAQRANTDIAAAGGAGQIASQMGPSGGDLMGGFLSNMGTNLLQGGGNNFFNSIGSFFGGGGQDLNPHNIPADFFGG